MDRTIDNSAVSHASGIGPIPLTLGSQSAVEVDLAARRLIGSPSAHFPRLRVFMATFEDSSANAIEPGFNGALGHGKRAQYGPNILFKKPH
ncbi:MAG: hypothetical protein AAFY28_22360, partial [Actinomycetota bacterium]